MHDSPELDPQRRDDDVDSVDSGATSVEYALMASLIAVVISGSVFIFGQAVMGLFAGAAAAL